MLEMLSDDLQRLLNDFLNRYRDKFTLKMRLQLRRSPSGYLGTHRQPAAETDEIARDGESNKLFKFKLK